MSVSGRSAKSGGSGRGVQFGRTIFKRDSASGDSSDDEEEEAPPPPAPTTDTGLSWNERMRHQAQPLVNRRQDSLDPVICSLFVVTLNRCAEALAIVRETDGIPPMDPNLEYVPVEEKYEQSDYYEMDAIADETVLHFNKMRRDLCWTEKVLRVAMENMRRSWSFESFIKVLNDYTLMREDEDQLLMAKHFNQNELLKLKQNAEAERTFLMRSIQLLTEQLGNSKDELNDSIMEYGVKTRFLKNWENARYEQNKMILTNTETSYLETTRTMNIQIERERRVHDEMETFIEESLKDYQEEIEQFMDKYDTDLDEYEIKIGKMRMEVDKQKEMYNILQNEFEDHKQFIQEYQEEKLRRQKAKEAEDRRINAATKIQSWWRGIMFRKGLGPFRRKKGKGKRGGSAKSSGKKKK